MRSRGEGAGGGRGGKDVVDAFLACFYSRFGWQHGMGRYTVVTLCPPPVLIP